MHPVQLLLFAETFLAAFRAKMISLRKKKKKKKLLTFIFLQLYMVLYIQT